MLGTIMRASCSCQTNEPVTGVVMDGPLGSPPLPPSPSHSGSRTRRAARSPSLIGWTLSADGVVGEGSFRQSSRVRLSSSIGMAMG